MNPAATRPPASAAIDLEREGATLAQRLPALLADAETLSATLMAGAHGRRRPGTGETFWQYRDYTSMDSASAIDWRQSARSPRRLYVRQTEWETAATVRLWCGGSGSLDYASGTLPAKRWRAQTLTVAVALLLTKAGERIGTLPAEGPGSGGQRAVMTLAERLLDGGQARPMLPPPLPPGTTQAVYISDFYAPTDEAIAAIEAVAAANVPCHLVQVSDPAEISFPFAGRVLFEDSATGRHRLFGNAGAVARAYDTARTAHLGAIEDTARKFGMTFLRHRTDQPATPVLAALHQAIAGRWAR